MKLSVGAHQAAPARASFCTGLTSLFIPVIIIDTGGNFVCATPPGSAFGEQ